MKFSIAAIIIAAACVTANKEERKLRRHSRKPKYDICEKKNYKKDVPKQSGPVTSQQLLLNNGIISKLPTNCTAGTGKNVILVIGDGMGWEMARAGAIAKRVLDELTSLGVDTTNGSTGAVADAAKLAFAGRQLKDYYLEGKLTVDKLSEIYLT